MTESKYHNSAKHISLYFRVITLQKGETENCRLQTVSIPNVRIWCTFQSLSMIERVQALDTIQKRQRTYYPLILGATTQSIGNHWRNKERGPTDFFLSAKRTCTWIYSAGGSTNSSTKASDIMHVKRITLKIMKSKEVTQEIINLLRRRHWIIKICLKKVSQLFKEHQRFYK